MNDLNELFKQTCHHIYGVYSCDYDLGEGRYYPEFMCVRWGQISSYDKGANPQGKWGDFNKRYNINDLSTAYEKVTSKHPEYNRSQILVAMEFEMEKLEADRQREEKAKRKIKELYK